MFQKKSRYQHASTCQRQDSRGRVVSLTGTPDLPGESFRGFHQRIQAQRLDHLAYRYLDDGAGFWRICELNDVMLPEALSEASDIAIPEK